MRFGVLGPLAVWTSRGEPVTLPGAKVRALLADLLVHEGRLVSADLLVDDLWGDEPLANPAGSLQVRVSQLRRALEEAEPGARDLVVSRSPGYLLNVDADAVDARRFAALTARAQETADPRARAGLLADALALWRGAAFADFADEEFTRPVIARLEEQRLAALELHAEARLELGEQVLLDDLVDRHPLRERLRAAHLRALYRAGRQNEALASYADLRDRLADELGLDPSPELAALHQAILRQDPSLDPAVVRPSTNLPASLTELVGRDEAVTEIRSLLASGRLVTLTGSGGVGKTSLALETARQLAGAYADGVWLVELAGLGRGAAFRLAEVVMGVLDVQDAGSAGEQVTSADRLTGALRGRELLLVLDNCEHVVEQVAELVDPLLRAAPGLRVLATSQEPLALPGEVVWSVPPLEVPGRDAGADLEALGQSSAVRLFVARASAAARSFTLDEETGPAIAVLCRRLDGIPLALELAATRVRALGVHGLVTRLDDRFRLLATGHRGAPPRQQTLMAMIDWSWELLSDPERVVLRRLAVHADGCALEAAEAVCADAGLDVLDLLARLVDRSLVVVVHDADGPRYRLLESVAAYCLDRMREAGELEEVRRRHHRHYTDLAVQAEPHLYGPAQRRWLRRLDTEAANLRSALDSLVREAAHEHALRLVNALAWYWFLRSRLTEARRSLEAALSGTPDDALARAWLTGIARLQGDPAPGEVRPDDIPDPGRRARAQWFLAYTGTDSGGLEASRKLLDQAMPTFQATGDRWGEAACLAVSAKLAHVKGDLAALERDAERSAKLFGDLGERWGQLEATGWLGGLAEMTSDYERATRMQREGLRMAEELSLWAEVSARLSWLGWIALQQGDFAQARPLCEQAMRLAVEQSHRPGQTFAAMGLGFSARREGLLDLAESHLRVLLDDAPELGPDETPAPYLPIVCTELGFLAEQRGDADRALALHARAIDLAARFEAVRDRTMALTGVAGALSLAGHHERAARMLGAATSAREANSVPVAPAEQDDAERIVSRVRAALGEEGFAAAFNEGEGLRPEEVRALYAED
ncbi:BTAD domain-containing putative transcriptional regulator [Nonomuraea sp. NPDC046570]|uniref:BTAD domain-containing putative transcriptional regulator n=1 Tax=Nonomuraea sp. NPDC046570 TaxID=3155255 RepID=UPI0033D0EDBD